MGSSVWLYIFFIISLYVLNKYKFDWSFIIVTTIFITINFIIDSRSRFFNNITSLNTEIEGFFEKELEIRKSYKVYDGILEVLNKIKVLVFYRPKFTDIICFKIIDDSIILENSSTFVWSYELDKKYLTDLMRENELDSYKHSNITLNLNGTDKSRNFILINETKKNKYVFMFIIEDSSNQLFNLYYTNLLQSITARISRVLDLENSIKDENKEILKIFIEKYFHMQNAEKAMHFIRNRFNTLDNFIEMSKDNIAGKMDDEDLKMYSTELQRLERNYDLLMKRVSSILNKPEKPFSAAQLESKSPNYLFSSLRDIWLDYFNEFDYELNWNISTIDNFLIQVNQDGLYILLTDWINNLKKYSNGNELVIFNEDENFLEVIFRNKYNKKAIDEIIDLKEDFNSKDRDRILKRTSHGVIIMKSILEEMLIKGKIKTDNENIDLILLFKKEKR